MHRNNSWARVKNNNVYNTNERKIETGMKLTKGQVEL